MNYKTQASKSFLEKKAQGSIEYLLLLAAAVVVVGVVISFMLNIIQPVTTDSDSQLLDLQCKTLDKNSLICGCYLCDNKKGGYEPLVGPGIIMANKLACTALIPAKGEAMKWCGRCEAVSVSCP
ncbi:MAG: class III signal peptide-containing protein [Candidatus Diapherotrites archaeon]|nr:class III signal peptide-containing protein [Candidatus Diapherotrites archaeon]